MKKIIITCQYDKKNMIERHLPVYIQGWLMERLNNDYAQKLHNLKMPPYSLSTNLKTGFIEFHISFLNDEAYQEIAPIILSSDNKIITLNSSEQKKFIIEDIKITTLSQSDLGKTFYHSNLDGNKFNITFLSPTSFKSNGEYIFYPDLRLFFQSLMTQYAYYLEDTMHVDTDLLSELVETTTVIKYDMQSYYYPVHNYRIPSFIGKIGIKNKGNSTIKNYLEMLCQFGEYTGVGIKTSMGMGAIKVERLGGKHGTRTS